MMKKMVSMKEERNLLDKSKGLCSTKPPSSSLVIQRFAYKIEFEVPVDNESDTIIQKEARWKCCSSWV
jgi:AAA+ superfamily predicted ATPase